MKALALGLALLAAAPAFAADMSPEARAALSIGGPWKSSESEHFVYHYVDEKLADTVLVHSEVYYGWIKELFGVSEDAWTRKVHVFVFHEKADWEAFIARAGTGLHPQAFTTGWELFILRDPSWIAPQVTLAHELTHVIAFRFLDGPIPMFLNEGLSDYIGWKAAAQKTDGDEYRVRTARFIAPEAFVPLAGLAATRDYPEDTKNFYRESELFVRFLLVKHPKGDFYGFLKAVSRGDSFERALEDRYGLTLEETSESFERFAIKGV